MKHLTYSPPPFIFVEGKKKSGMTSLSREPGIPPYIPELPVPHENVMNYNQTVLGIRGGQKISLFLLLANQRIFFLSFFVTFFYHLFIIFLPVSSHFSISTPSSFSLLSPSGLTPLSSLYVGLSYFLHLCILSDRL